MGDSCFSGSRVEDSVEQFREFPTRRGRLVNDVKERVEQNRVNICDANI